MRAEKILVCLHDFACGGSERIAIGLAGAWAKMGRQIIILCGSQEGGLREIVDSQVGLVTLSPNIPRSLLSRFFLGKEMGRHLAELRPQVIFLPGNYHIFLARGLRRADPGTPILMKISNPLLPNRLARRIARPLFQYWAQPIDGFAALTPNSQRELAQLAPNKQSHVLGDPIFVEPAVNGRTQCNGHCEIVWAGRLEPQKDVGLALKTIALLDESIHLTILGEGNLAEKTDRMIKQMNLSHRVKRLGHVLRIDSYLVRASALLMTSHYEGQPAVVGEALSLGVPVVSTDCTAMLRDVITIPQAGRIVSTRSATDLAKALSEVCAQPKPQSNKLAALVSRFEPQACAKAYLEWFDSMADSRYVV